MQPSRMLELLHTDREFLIYGVWVATIGSLCAGVLFAALAAIFAVINTATTPSGSLTGVPGLYLWNFFTLFFNLAAVSLWITQFYQKLQYNVMSMEDQRNMWSSTDMAKFGYSFWFVVGATIASFVSLVIIYIGTSEGRQKKTPQPMIEEKSNGAIMLY
ncbi:Uncharacterized protein GBIM_08829 [Gryllus bimaculatus]|nr:Uncharacterized protein GBIM_08829 [Gryllus bimaculatus]